jgi:SAM-dependent methyltransferase
MEDAYREDLAFIHDAGHGHFARAAAGLLQVELRQRAWEGGLVIDLGCGSGILAGQLSDCGFDVLGIDISEAMIALARQRVPKGVFRVQSLLAADLPPCVAVAAVGECLNYLFDPGHSRGAVRQVLARAYAALAPNGLLILDVAEPGKVPGPGPSKKFVEGDGWAVFATAVEDRQQGLLTRQITSFRKVGDFYRRDHEVHRLRLVPRAQLLTWLREIGFEAQLLAGYGPVPFRQGGAGFLAAKPK